MFAIALRKPGGLLPRFVPLAYSDICAADKIRTKVLCKQDIPFRSHLRRRGGASDLFDAGVPITDIKVIGHWSMEVLDVYLSWSPSLITQLQLQGILRAEQRNKFQWPSLIMVHYFFNHSQAQ